MLAAPGSRVVTVGSLSQKFGRIRWDDVHCERSYRQSTAYAQSKLACLLFAFGLQRRLRAAGHEAESLAAHPGFANTNILKRDGHPRLGELERRLGEPFIQTAAEVSQSLLRAATDRGAYGGQFYGPSKRFGIEGRPGPPVGPVGATHRRGVPDRSGLSHLAAGALGVSGPAGGTPHATSEHLQDLACRSPPAGVRTPRIRSCRRRSSVGRGALGSGGGE